MRSSDQRYRQVQRAKRDRKPWELASRKLAIALRAVRAGDGDFSAVEAAIRAGASEFNHVLLACGRTATDFRRNYRVGSPNWHIVNANAICPLSLLQRERLDGFVVMRLSREQAKNVKLRWAKLREQDILIHDPQGTHWAEIVGCLVDGERDEHLAVLTGLRERGASLVRENMARSVELRDQRQHKELVRFATTPDALFADQERWSADKCREKAMICWFVAKKLAREGFKDVAGVAVFSPRVKYHNSVAEWRLELERNLVVAEAFADGGDVLQASFAPDTSKRHTAHAHRIERVERLVGKVFEAERERYQAAKRERAESRRQATEPTQRHLE